MYRQTLSFHVFFYGEGGGWQKVERGMEDNTISDCDRDTKNSIVYGWGEGVFIFDNYLFLCSLCV